MEAAVEVAAGEAVIMMTSTMTKRKMADADLRSRNLEMRKNLRKKSVNKSC